MTTALKVPTIHLNGSDGEKLVGTLLHTIYTLNKAIESLQETAPHGRDYYPQGDDVIRVAIEEYRSRLSRLMSVDKELKEIIFAVQEQLDVREANRR